MNNLKVLWLSSYPVPQLCTEIGLKAIVNEGWKCTLFNQLSAAKNIEFIYVFPYGGKTSLKSGDACGVRYYIIHSSDAPDTYNALQEAELVKILQEETPDVIHIWGTEFPHALAMANAALQTGHISRLVASLQGIMGECADSYDKCLPFGVKYRRLFGDILLGRGIQKEKRRFKRRADLEKAFLEKTQHVIGRTDFDLAYSRIVNQNLTYYHCDETLREIFYTSVWEYEKCVPHTVFISQATYPIKGLHLFLEALKLVVERFPDTMVYISGGDILTRKKGWKSIVQKYSYSCYLQRLVKKNHLSDHITMLGTLEAAEMKEQYLKTNVFVSSSVMENSPNSVGEAMLLGVPTVASNVGGTSSILTHGKDGYLYQYDLPYMCAFYICSLFSDPSHAKLLGKNARAHAQITHNPDRNLSTLIAIYECIGKHSAQE